MGSVTLFFVSLNSLLAAIFTALLITVLVRTKNNTTSKSLLIILMLCQVYSKALIALKTNGLLFQWAPFLYRSSYPFELASSPLVYLYILSITKVDFKWQKIQWYHGLPVVIGLTWYLLAPFDLNTTQLDKYLRNIPIFLIMLPYLWASQKVIAQAKNQAENHRSSLVELHLPWLRFLLLICYAALVLTFLDLLTGPAVPLYIYSGVITNCALIGLTYFGLNASQFFKQDDKATLVEEASPAINSVEIAELSERLLKRLKEDQLFLRPQIRLVDVASEMNIKSYKLTEVINRGLNTNFYELINGLRIQRAMELLRDPNQDHLNLLGIAMDSGFNSKSVFNDYFRRTTGMTPSEFRQKRSNSSESSN